MRGREHYKHSGQESTVKFLQGSHSTNEPLTRENKVQAKILETPWRSVCHFVTDMSGIQLSVLANITLTTLF